MVTFPDFKDVDFLILDNTAFVSGFNLNIIKSQNPDIKIYITHLIYEEAMKNFHSKQIIEVAELQSSLFIEEPSQEMLNTVIKMATTSGDIGALSKPDQSIIALALEMKQTNLDSKVVLMSDDYTVQNTATRLKLSLFSYSKKGIKKTYRWEIYCPNCFRTYEPKLLGEECEFCGGILKRRTFKGKRKHL